MFGSMEATKIGWFRNSSPTAQLLSGRLLSIALSHFRECLTILHCHGSIDFNVPWLEILCVIFGTRTINRLTKMWEQTII